MDFNQSISCIDAMLRKERTIYRVSGYLHHLPAHIYGDRPVDSSAREAIANWFVRICDLCHYSLETAEIATSILDRFAATPSARDVIKNRETFQLASLASIYTAVKIHEHEAMSPKFVAKLSGGLNTPHDIERMEYRILKALKWNVNPPTAMWFVRNFLLLIAEDVFNGSQEMILDIIQKQLSSSVTKYEFCVERPSELALASLLNVVEDLYDAKMCTMQLQALICHATEMRPKSLELLRLRLRGATYHEAISGILKRQGIEKRTHCKHIYMKSQTQEMQYTHSPKSITTSS